MPASETDQEQIEILKKWWNDYGKLVVITIALGLTVGFGWRYWHQQKIQTQYKASSMYQQLLLANTKNQSDTIIQIDQEIQTRYPKTEYAHLSRLISAKIAVENNHYDMALQNLQSIIQQTKMDALKQIARLRAARILLALKKNQEALDLLTTVDDPTYQPLIDEVKGDIYQAMGQTKQAKEAYQSAQNGLSEIIGEDQLLSLQLAQP